MRFPLFTLLLFCFACGTTPAPEVTPAPAKDTLPLPEPSTEEKVASLVIQPLDYDTSRWTDIADLDSSIILDIRYATTNNFVKEQLYDCGRCFLRPPAAAALVRAQARFQKQGLRLKMLDCFRPRPIQQKLWDKFQDPSYVTPPSKGSMHNRGLAVDLTLVDAQGQQLDMGTPFDFFGPKAHHTYKDLPEEVLANRQLLKSTLEAEGFRGIRTEWWHYSFSTGKHELSDMLWECPEADH